LPSKARDGRKEYQTQYAVAQNSSEYTEPANSTTMIELFIQDNFCEFVQPR